MCFDSLNDRVYCTNARSNNVTVIDGASNRIVKTIPVGLAPENCVLNPLLSRVYVVNTEGFSISVIRDSATGIVEDGGLQDWDFALTATLARGVLFLSPLSDARSEATSVLLDISGRKVLALHPGANDVRALALGVYFVYQGAARREQGGDRVRKVVVTR
jgi:YVTN family beta-propeller protein